MSDENAVAEPSADESATPAESASAVTETPSAAPAGTTPSETELLRREVEDIKRQFAEATGEQGAEEQAEPEPQPKPEPEPADIDAMSPSEVVRFIEGRRKQGEAKIAERIAKAEAAIALAAANRDVDRFAQTEPHFREHLPAMIAITERVRGLSVEEAYVLAKDKAERAAKAKPPPSPQPKTEPPPVPSPAQTRLPPAPARPGTGQPGPRRGLSDDDVIERVLREHGYGGQEE